MSGFFTLKKLHRQQNIDAVKLRYRVAVLPERVKFGLNLNSIVVVCIEPQNFNNFLIPANLVIRASPPTPPKW
jgi:hypothetical protein